MLKTEFPKTRVGLIILCALAMTRFAMGQEVTTQDIRDAILGSRSFTQEELSAMDLNDDSRVDVADLVVLLNPESEHQSSTMNIHEGDGTIEVLFYLPSVYAGPVTYTVSGTATAGADFEPLPGSINANGSSVAIPVTFIDDLLIEDIEMLSIKLETSSDELLTLGPSKERTVYIQDNDVNWKGSLAISNLTNGFEMTMLQSSASFSAEMHSDGIGGIPAGEWPVTVEAGSGYFKCILGPIDVPADLTLFKAAMHRTIALESKPSEEYPDDVLNYDSIIVGRLTESIMVGDGKSYLSLTGNDAVSGNFTLVKMISMLPDTDSKDPSKNN